MNYLETPTPLLDSLLHIAAWAVIAVTPFILALLCHMPKGNNHD